jgi:hypothetical protein
MHRQADLNQTNTTDHASSRSSSKRKLSIVSRPSSRRIDEQVEAKGGLEALLGCGRSRIASEKQIESVIVLSVKRQLESKRPSISVSLRSILTDPDPLSPPPAFLWNCNSPINNLLSFN